MNILVIGLGSMGKRRICLLKDMYPDYFLCGVDARVDRREEVSRDFGMECVESLENAVIRFSIDSAFVCTSPLSHGDIISFCLKHHWNVFTELNLVEDSYEKNMKLASKNKCVLFLSSTFFYREEIRYLRSKVNDKSKWNYIYHIGQYLPDWHPWEPYKDFFVGNKKTNGCREIMAIELPWISQSFGEITEIQVLSDKMTGLEIEYNDNYMLQLRHANGNKGVLVVDVVSPVAVRRLELYGEHKYLSWNGTPDTLWEYDKCSNRLVQVQLHEKEEHREGYRAFVVENAYRNEIKEFVNVVETGKKPIYGFAEDLKILRLIDRVEAEA